MSKMTLEELIYKMSKLKNEIPKVEKDILKEMVGTAKEEITQAVSSDSFENTDPISVESDEKSVGLTGAQAIYDEFGTGTMGENNPHPDKGEFSLNPYNSGSTIRENKNDSQANENGIPDGGLYWTYEYGGKKIYTQGRPAGAYVYKGFNKIKQEKDKIVKEKVGDMLSKL